MLVKVEERYEQYQVLHVGAGASTDQKPPDSSFPFGVYVRGGYDDRNLFGRGWTLTSQLTYGTAILRANVGFLDRRFLGTLFRFDASFTYLQQETVRLGDIHSGGGSIGFSREMYPGVDAGLHYNLRNTTHTEPLLREAGPDENTQSVTLGTTVGSLSANVEWLRMDNRLLPTRGFRIDAIAELALPALSVPLRPFPFAIGDDTFLKVGVHSLSVIPLGKHLFLRHGFRYDQGFPLRRRVAAPQGRALLRRRRHHHPRLSSSIARASRSSEFPLVPNPQGGVASTPSSTARSAATCASCRTSTCSSPSSPPGTARSSWTTAWSPTRSTGSGSRSFATASASRRCSSACRSATSAWPGAGRSIPARATPASASSTSTSA